MISDHERSYLKMLFHKAFNGLRSQNFERCTMTVIDRDGDKVVSCVLSNTAGQRCAIGWMLDDPGEPGLVSSMDVKILEQKNLSFIRDMRNAHDHSHEPGIMECRLKAVAVLWGLQ